jgi:iron complex outermembrane receptor protein
MKRFYLNSLLMFLSVGALMAQDGKVVGTVSEDGDPLIGVSISVDGTAKGAVTDIDGRYEIALSEGTYNLTASYVGYATINQAVSITAGQMSTLDFDMQAGIMVDEVVVTGTRASNRTNLESPVPVDVINVSQLAVSAPQVAINQLLQQTTPSFSSNTQTISDGTDHIDPASLRGLGPDQVLVLINGKRRHTTSLVNVNGTFGRGNVGTDLNAIPVAAIDRIEVLRDGAAAQYGSDAIAGVINIKLKENVDELFLSLTTGANFTDAIGPFEGEEKDYDGEIFNLGANYGLPLGDNGGFINLTGEMNFRGSTNRMLEWGGGIFNGLNAIERMAAADGLDVTKLTIDEIKSYGSQVGYFSQETKDALNALTSLDGLSDVLDFDATDAELAARNQTRSDYNMRVGQSEVRGGKMMANMSLPVGDNGELYAFGAASYRRGSSGCFYRLPSQERTLTSIFPNGMVPRINSNINDKSLGAGIRGMVGDWNSDLSLVTGGNSFLFHMTNTHNATLGTSSPTEFDAGGHSFNQSTANFDLSKYYDGLNGINGLNVAFGAEYRYENYQVIRGSEESWGNYDINGNLVTPSTPDELKSTDLFGRARPSGAQCFAGFLPFNEVDANRSSVGGYLDLEADITDAFLLGIAGRYEDYSDFGETFNYKATARYKVSDNLAVRGAFSTGFRAPSLHQIHFSRTSTIFSLVNGVSVPQEVGIFANTSRAAKLLGIPELKEETSQNMSVGFTMKLPSAGLRVTIDAYQVNIDDRIILTGQFDPGSNVELQRLFEQSGATKAAFFANSINTISQGIDVVIAHNINLGSDMNLASDLAATFSQTEWDQDAGINASKILEDAGLVDTYFDQTSRIYLEQAVPRTKISLGNNLTVGNFSVYLRNTFFGETTEATNEGIFDEDLELLDDATLDPYYAGKVITDLSVGYKFSDAFSLTLGANNLLDVYPDEAESAFSSSGRFVYSRRSPQFSYSGRHIFARVLLTL